ncbi:MAG: heme-binding protein [Phycisphaerae bacterium]|nr:heme-binding protein [Gemmatimonadaceae bacterium]
MTKKLSVALGLVALATVSAESGAQDAPPYGAQITLDVARKVAAGAEVEARKNNWRMAIAIVDNHGTLVYYQMLDDTQTGSAVVAVEKARTSAMFRRPSKAFEDNIAGGRNAILGLPGVTPVEGGVPIVVGGKQIGAIGVSGASSAQDGIVAKAGIDALGKP